MERMWVVPWGGGANCTKQFVVRGGVLHLRRRCVVRRFTLTKGCRSWEGTFSSKLVIETISNPMVY
jgi:hypothetical protein